MYLKCRYNGSIIEKIKIAEKEDKYTNIIQSFKVANPGYLVKTTHVYSQLYGRLLNQVISSITDIIPEIQKIVITEANSTINHFKILTMK